MNKQTIKYKYYWDSFEVLYRKSTKTNSLSTDVDLGLLRSIYDKILSQIDHRGERACVKLIKDLRLCLYKHIAGEQSDVSFLKLDPVTSLPAIFGPVIGGRVAARDRHTIRMLLTILQVSYIITDNKLIPDISTINAPQTTNFEELYDFEAFIRKYANRILNPGRIELPDWTDPHESTSAGPVGPAVWSIPIEISLLNQELIDHISNLGGDELSVYLHECYNNKSLIMDAFKFIELKRTKVPYLGTKRKSLRRLVAIPAPEMKTRIIAILDWWSQTALRPLHYWAFDLLRPITSDMTFNQDGFIEVLPKIGPYHSFDLSAATDRFPIHYQEIMLQAMIGEDKARAWRSLLTNYTFETDWGPTVKYTVGQPMGAYSSWSVFTLCHHLVVRYSAKLANLDPVKFNQYVILGDDIVIANSLVADKYKTVMSHLGVGLSRNKSLVSDNTYEFAKRIVHRGKEYTAFPLASMIESSSSITALWASTIVAKERDFTFLDFSSNPGFVADIQRANGIIVRNAKSIAKDLEALHLITHQAYQDTHEFRSCLFHIIRSFNMPAPCTTNTFKLYDYVDIELGGCIVKYKNQLLLETSEKYLDLRRDYTQYMIQFLEECADQGIPLPKAASTVLIRDYPLMRLMGLATLKIMRENNHLRSVLSERAPGVSLCLGVTPVGDLLKVISRRVNTRASTRHAIFLRTLKYEVIRMQMRRQRELSGV